MSEGSQTVRTEHVLFKEVAPRITCLPAFGGAAGDKASPYGAFGDKTVDLVHAPAGAVLVHAGDSPLVYWLVLKGKLRAEHVEQDGSVTAIGYADQGEGSGELPLMHGRTSAMFSILADVDSEVVRFTAEQFWQLLACCPEIRTVAIRDMSNRVQAYQVEALHREKLVTLGTLAAGLMHELHNPGTAAKRAAATLRENLKRLQEISLRHSAQPKTAEQLGCMRSLLEHSIRSCRMQALSSLDQSEAEEAMSEWLLNAGVENAYVIGPALVEMGFNVEELRCAQTAFDAAALSDTLNWLGALVSSLSQVCTIEESLERVSDLVMAVKKFAYDSRDNQKRAIDVHDSLQSTLTILGHKLRIKQLKVEKRFDASPSTIETKGSILGQVWTNLIDNAADASPANSEIEIATWTEPEWLAVSITDHGHGIPAEVLPHIFEAFFTTKPQGSGTGLGLEIVHRIVTQKFGGRIEVESKPGNTTFTVRLPRQSAAADEKTAQSQAASA